MKNPRLKAGDFLFIFLVIIKACSSLATLPLIFLVALHKCQIPIRVNFICFAISNNLIGCFSSLFYEFIE